MMINVNLLKKRILDLAFRGQLTEHHENESSIELLPKLFNNKKKKYISFSPELAGFEIPFNWNWCMTYQAVSLDNGDETSGEKLPYLEVKFLRTGKDPKIINSGVIVDKGEKLILVDGENSGEVFLANERGYKGSTLKILNISDAFIEKYIFLFIYSCKEGFRKNKTGAAIPHLDKKRLFETPLPIPPLEEQKRIADKLDEIFAELDKIDEKQIRLATIQEKMEAKILKLAIQGKLVEQRPEEGTGEELFKLIQEEKQELIKQGKIKKEKPLPIIEEDAIQFVIPSTWKWARLGELFFIGTGKTPLKGNREYYDGGDINWATSSLTGNRYISNTPTKITNIALVENNLRVYPAHTLIVAMYGEGKTRGQISELLIPSTINQACAAIEPILLDNTDLVKYVFYYFKFMYDDLREKAGGAQQPNLNMDIIKRFAIPLPPLKEQKRIVAKIEELLPLCRSN